MYKLRLFENYLQERITLTQLTNTIIPNYKHWVNDLSKLGDTTIYRDDGEPLYFTSPKELIIYLIQNKILPTGLKDRIKFMKDKRGLSVSDAIDTYLKAEPDFTSLLNSIIKAPASQEDLNTVAQSKNNKNLSRQGVYNKATGNA